ncbi:MAG: hypothetical protein ACMUIP_13365 [bacterium]
MSLSCQKCRFNNPWGAQICGECGEGLIFEIDRDRNEKKLIQENLPRLPKSRDRDKHEEKFSIDSYSLLARPEPNRKASMPIVFRILGYVLLVNAISLIGISFTPYFFPFMADYKYSFIVVFLCLGGLGVIVSYGFLQAKQWIFSVYSMWVAIKIFLYALLWAGLWQPVPPSWLTSNRMGALLVVLIIEIALIPYVFVTSDRMEMEEEKFRFLE